MEDNFPQEIKASKLIFFILILLLLLGLLAFCIVFSMIPNIIPFSFLPLLISSPMLVIMLVSLYLIQKNRFGLVKFFLSQNKIVLSFHKKIFFEIDPDMIEEVIITHHTIEKIPQRFVLTNTYEGDSVRFNSSTFQQKVKLWCCGFSKSKQSLITDSIINICQILNKSVKIIDARDIIIKVSDIPCSEISNFLKNLK